MDPASTRQASGPEPEHGANRDWRISADGDPNRVADLMRQLREQQSEKERIGHALAAISAELRESRESSRRLFEALCRSLPGRALGGRFEILHRIGAGGMASSSTPWIAARIGTSP